MSDTTTTPPTAIDSDRFDVCDEAHYRVLIAGEVIRHATRVEGVGSVGMVDGRLTHLPVTITLGATPKLPVPVQKWVDASVNVAPLPVRQMRIEQLAQDKVTVLRSWTYDDAELLAFDEGQFNANSHEFRLCSLTFCGRCAVSTPTQ